MRQWTRRAVPWIGGWFIGAILTLAAYDIYQGYYVAVASTSRELQTQARVIAEQTARTIQAVDVAMRHLVDQSQDGRLARLGELDLQQYLREQAVGLVQISGLVVVDAASANASGYPYFRLLRDQPDTGLYIGDAYQSPADNVWAFPIARRVRTPSGEFVGVVGARGRVDYFEQFYRNVQLDAATSIALMHQDGTLIARHPRVESALGRQFPLFERMLAGETPGSTVSLVDGVESFAALKVVADYPLAVIVTRDAAAALAPWRAQALRTGARTLALSALAVFLLVMVVRQLSRLQATQERYALAVAGSEYGIWDYDLVERRVFASAKAREISGMPPGPETQTIEEWLATVPIHPEDAARRLAAQEAHLAGTTPAYEGEFRLRQPDGRYRWVRIHGLALRDAQGKPYRMAGSTTDIDERKRAEEALRLSQERYALAVAGSDDGVWDFDFANRRVFASARAREICGLPPGPDTQPMDEWFAALPIHPEDAPERIEAMEAHLAGKTPAYEGEWRMRQADGAYRWIKIHGLCIRDTEGKPHRMAGSISDIDARRRAEESLRRSEERFALAVAGSNDGIMDWDIATDRMYTSERAMQILGIDSTLTVRSRMELRELLRYHPDDTPRVRDDLDRLLEGRNELRDSEYRVQLPGGGYRWIRYRNKAVYDASGRPVRVAGSVSDIDAQKRVEEALRSSEEQYKAVFNAAADALVVRDASAKVVDVNPAFLQMMGYRREEIIGNDRWNFSGPQGLDEARRFHTRIIAGESLHIEIASRRKDGIAIDLDIRAVPIVHLGKAHTLAMARDITAQKRFEETLRSSEEQYRAIFNAAADALVLRDADARVVDVNPAFLQISGYSREEVLNSERWVFALPETRELGAQMHRRVIAGESVHFELRAQRKDGTRMDIEMRAVPIRYRGVPHALGMARDITAQKRAAEALRESEERYQLAVTGANQGLWDWDLASDTMFVSARAQEFMGLEPGEPLRPRREWIALSTYHPDDIGAARGAMSEHLRGESKYYSVEYRLRHPSGEWHWYRQRGVALRDAAGRPYRMAGSMEDITEYKKLGGELLQAKKLEAIGTLAGGIAHDFNNILAAILGYGEMAQKNAAPATPLRRYVDAVVSAGLRAKSLVERILAFSRSGIGERRPVHVQSVVSEALDLVAASLPKHVKLERELDAGDAAVLGDATQVHQVVMNLCANGAQAMKAPGMLTVSLDVVQKTIRLRVRDTGIGIAPNLLERIFDPFFTTKEVGVGTGLGLSMVYGIVTDLGGSIDVESKPGEGAVFTVHLPWTSTTAVSSRVEEAIARGEGEAILLVDDEEPLVRLGEEMLAQLGYEPVGFTSSVAALEAFRAAPERFDAVLSDESMPDLTGSDLAREIRTLRPEIPIVLMSGVVSPGLSVRARELAIAEVLAKPLAERDIGRALASAIQGRHQ